MQNLSDNLLLRADSYKSSHWLQYPPNTQTVHSYIESRGGAFRHSVFFGLQAYLRQYLSQPITREHVAQAAQVYTAHGMPFNEAGWLALVAQHGGRLPIRIRALPEGSVTPTHQVLATVENTDPQFYWLTSFMETELLRAIWYPTTVATLSAHAKATLLRYLNATSDDPLVQIPFKLHDFGARGVSSFESACLGAMAHLVSFQGTDTVSAILAARQYYDCPMAGFSIPAAEHSTMTSWGREHEEDAYRNMLQCFAKPGALLAVVSDSYDIFNACENIWGGTLRQQVIDSGATLVIRPDSGDPAETVLRVLQILDRRFGVTTNRKGFRVLNHVRVIQGDGITLDSLRLVLSNMYHNGYSADNVSFGMGGGLLQQVNRDTMRFAMKCSAVQVDGQWRDVFKNPVGDPIKASKKGRLTLVKQIINGAAQVRTVRVEEAMGEEVLHTAFENGQLLQTTTFDEVRQRAALGMDLLAVNGLPL